MSLDEIAAHSGAFARRWEERNHAMGFIFIKLLWYDVNAQEQLKNQFRNVLSGCA